MASPNLKLLQSEAMNNRYWYEQGRSDQRRGDWPVIAACLLAIALYIVFVEKTS